MAGWLYPQVFIYCLSALIHPLFLHWQWRRTQSAFHKWHSAFPVEGTQEILQEEGFLFLVLVCFFWGPYTWTVPETVQQTSISFHPHQTAEADSMWVLEMSQKLPSQHWPICTRRVSHTCDGQPPGPRWPSRHFSTIHTFSQHSLNFSLSSPWSFLLGPHVFFYPFRVNLWYS